MIRTSLDWNTLETTFKNNIRDLTYKKDILKLIENIGQEVKKLSIAEISARRGHPTASKELLAKINHDIEMVKEYILIATLLG